MMIEKKKKGIYIGEFDLKFEDEQMCIRWDLRIKAGYKLGKL